MKIIGGLEDRPCWAAYLEESHLPFCIIQLTTWDTVEKKTLVNQGKKSNRTYQLAFLKFQKPLRIDIHHHQQKHCLNTKKRKLLLPKIN